MQPWTVLDRVATAEGPMELRQRGTTNFLITIGGRVLMTSAAHRSEDALAELTCEALAARKHPRLLIGGLGMGLTLRAALNALPPSAQVTVAELHERVVDWCREPLAPLCGRALADPRVRVRVADVAQHITEARPRAYDAIALDLYEGPPRRDGRREDPLYGPTAIDNVRRALQPGGVFAVWSEDESELFRTRLAAAGFAVQSHRAGRGGRTHVVYLATM